MEKVQDKFKKALPSLTKNLGLSNNMSAPRIEKVIVSVGTASYKDKKKYELVLNRLAQITGQKPATTVAKKSIASFKLRAGDQAGVKVTLRGARMYDFLDRLINIAIPRERDFRGIKQSAIDDMGNISIGFKEHTIFPETADEDVKDVFSFGVTIATTAKDKKQALALFQAIGLPFKK